MKEKKMLMKFDQKSDRVKGLAFHPRRPWILASLHNGAVMMWDYRMQVLVDKFEEHDGPVRGVHFHVSQPLFVSGGDDYKIKVWNYQLKRCLFNLLGHLDYIRTVQFHHEHPWILSASDDQTIRIWNWQSRQCLSVLTGHNHYVMCAQFHHTEDLVLSASLDQTVRVWDLSGLRKKTVSIATGPQDPSPQTDLFGGTDVVVRHVLEGHSRGVNWAAFHPTLSLIVSGADDREVKLWRMNDAKAWEVDTMRGHINNVSCVVFHPKQELIISNSEDKSIRVWDISKQNSPVTMRRENDRYWILAAHPNANLLAAGHDSGVVVFKLDKERPAFEMSDNALYYHKDLYIYEHNTKTGKDKPIASTRRRGGESSGVPSSMCYNSSNKTQHNVLLCYDSDGSYELYNVNVGGDNSRDDGASALRGFGKCAIFVSRNRFAVMDKSRQIWLKNLANETKRQITVPNALVTAMFPGGVGRLLLRSADAMILFDIQALKVIAELPMQSRHVIKHVSWSKDNKHVAMFSRSGIHIASSKLEELCCVTETGKIKSGTWDPCGVFVYTTPTHLKYLLPNGDHGTIRTLEQTVYLVSVSQGTAVFMDREKAMGKVVFDDTEYVFKLALHSKKNRDVFRIMQSKKLVGRSITAYLHEKGFPEVALHFVTDAEAKFPLALECGNIGAALECATQLDNDECWHKLGVEALRQGNHQVVEAAYQKTKNFERLSFLYLITGNLDKLRKMLHIATLTEDLMGRYHNALYLGDVAERVAVLRDAGRTKLAYITAKAHGLEEEVAALAEVLGEDNIPPLPKRLGRGKLLVPATPLLRAANWPILATRKTFFDLLEQEEGGETSAETAQEVQALMAEEAQNDSDAMEDALGDWGGDDDDMGLGLMGEEATSAADTSLGGGWGDDMGDMGLGLGSVGGDDDEIGVGSGGGDSDDMFVMPMQGRSAAAQWQEHSSLACHLVAAGAFDQAMHVLNRTIGVVNFAPLKPSFFAIHRVAYATLPQLPGGADLVSPLQLAQGSDDAMLPSVCVTLPQCVELLKKAYAAVTGGKFTVALAACTAILHALPLLCAESKAQEKEAVELGQISREYVTAMRLELAKRDTTDPARKASLAVHFTLCKLQPMHNILALRVAIKTCFAIKCFKTTGALCRRVLDLGVSSNKEALQKVVKFQEIRDVLKRCEQEATEAHSLDVDESAKFTLCASTLTRIAKGQQTVACPFCKSTFAEEFAGTLCATCDLSKVGAECSGLKIFNE